jgi:tripartite-type tricarboxylate transporter receptor subunit TctC
MKRVTLVAVLCVMMGGLLTSNCLAQDAAAFYKGKTITVLISTNPGGTFDLISRVMAPYLEKHTGAKLLMQNGMHIQVQNMLFRSKPDGLTVVLCGHGPKEITAQLFKQEGISFDWTKFALLGRLPSSSTAFAVDKKLGWKKPTDLQGKAFKAGASSPFFEPLFAEALGWDKMSVVPGMAGGERVLAMRRGETQGMAGGSAQMTKDADLMIPIVVSTKDEKGFPGIPTAKDAAVKGKEKWGRLAAAWDELLYWSYATPGIPQDRAAFLESALQKTYNDPAFRADMDKLKIDLSDHFVNGKELKALASEIGDLNNAEIKEMQFVIERKYQKF